MPPDFISNLYVFILAGFVGFGSSDGFPPFSTRP